MFIAFLTLALERSPQASSGAFSPKLTSFGLKPSLSAGFRKIGLQFQEHTEHFLHTPH